MNDPGATVALGQARPGLALNAPGLALNTIVEVAIAGEARIDWHRATIIGRTFEAEPRFDVRLTDGAILAGVPAAQVRAV